MECSSVVDQDASFCRHHQKCRQEYRQRGKYQQGIALITAMVIMAIAVSLAASLAYRHQLSIRLSGNLSALEQAYQYATGMEAWAGIILLNDFRDNSIDSLDDTWATLIPPIPIPGGFMNGQLFDLQARINLNDVIETIDDHGQEVQRPFIPQTALLGNLLTRLQIPKEPLVDSLIDWLDENEQESQSGAESSYYKILEQPYLSANSSLVSFSELRLIKGFNEKITDSEGKDVDILPQIKPFLAVLPAKKIKINVNTASFDVLYALGNVDESQINNVIEDRKEEPFPSVADFTRSLQLDNENDFPADLLSVTSEYFLLQGLVQIGKVRIFINSTLHRDDTGRTRVISREFSET